MAVPSIYSAGMSGNTGDSPHISLVKIVAQLYELVVTSGGMSVPQLYSKMSANTGDSQQMCLVKIAALLNAFVTGGGAGSGLVFSTGTGSPEGAVAGSPGDTYWDTGASNYYIKITGSGTNTGWAIH